jgi:antirestriction protein ArdC
VGNLRHPEYLASWIKRLHDDKRAIIRAATLAQKAVDFILSGGGQFDEEEESEESEETAAK